MTVVSVGAATTADPSAWTATLDSLLPFTSGNVLISGLAGQPPLLSASILIANNMPLDDQWEMGSYTPDNLDLNSRSVVISATAKITDPEMYNLIAYDASDSTPSAWAANVFKDGIAFDLISTQLIDTLPYEVTFNTDGEELTSDNFAFQISPISLRAGKQVIANFTATMLADLNGQFEITLVTDLDEEFDYIPEE